MINDEAETSFRMRRHADRQAALDEENTVREVKRLMAEDADRQDRETMSAATEAANRATEAAAAATANANLAVEAAANARETMTKRRVRRQLEMQEEQLQKQQGRPSRDNE